MIFIAVSFTCGFLLDNPPGVNSSTLHENTTGKYVSIVYVHIPNGEICTKVTPGHPDLREMNSMRNQPITCTVLSLR